MLSGVLEQILPLSLIRVHIADDDTQRFDAAQLELYREAAFEECERYTGLDLTSGMHQEQEEVSLKVGFSFARDMRPTWHTLRHPSSTGIINIVNSLGGMQELRIAVGSNRVPLHTFNEIVHMGSGQGNCGPIHPREVYTIVYTTGTNNPRPLSASLKLGILKFIAWSVTNAGDTVVTVGSSTAIDKQNQFNLGTNNVSVASGAVDLWRNSRQSLVR